VDKLEFSLLTEANGNPIHLDSMSAASAKAFASIIQSLTEIVANTPNGDQLKINIKEGSAAVSVDGPQEIVATVYSDYKKIVEKNSTVKTLVDEWRNIQNTIKSNGIAYNSGFFTGETVAFDIKQEIIQAPQFRLKPSYQKPEVFPFFVQGKMIELGGKNPNLHILNAGDEVITISCSSEDVLRIKTFLGVRSYICAWKKEKEGQRDKYEYCDIYTNEEHYLIFKNFFNQSPNESFSDFLYRLHHKIKDLLQSREFDLLKKMYRILKHKSTHPSTLMTALIISKSFRDSDELGPAIEELKLFLESILKEPLL
jgi:hypothetical protein